ncbi:MAG: type II toxin-antitoxin system Phd/YefM family antitoxin [Deltaproteobacteria bacterium]|nr:type II toxin-antitoxin system Phd/YefM family antitoxin [Deltaproteobacteria bacterium]
MKKHTKRMVKYLPITEARRHLGEVIKKVRINKDYFVLEKDGIPVVGLMDIDEFEDYMELQDPNIKKQIRKSYGEYTKGKSRPVKDFLSELEEKKR